MSCKWDIINLDKKLGEKFMNRKEMLEKVKEQLSRDYNCSIEDFNK